MANFIHKSSFLNSSSLFKKVRKRDAANAARIKSHSSATTLSDNVPGRKGFRVPFLNARVSFQTLVGLFILFILIVGSVSAFFLTQINQDVRQQASALPYCGDGICQDPGNPCQCLADCGNAPGADQCAIGTAGSSSTCGSGEIFCGGCINDCRPATETCNTQIDNECKQIGCGGNGVFPGAGEQCCSGLEQCANGRCAPSCSLDSNPICGGIREGSNCNNGGAWTCDSIADGGSGHCEGGVWNQPSATIPVSISCDLSGHIVYFETQEACDNAKNTFKTSPLGGVTNAVTGVIESVKEILSTVSSTRTSEHTEKCNLNGTIVYVAAESVCNQFGGNLIASAGGSCVPGEATQCVGGTKFECMNESWVNQGSCLLTDTFSTFSLCKAAKTTGYICWQDGGVWVLREELKPEIIPAEGGGCTSGESSQCIDGDMLECKNGSWSSIGYGCGTNGDGDFVNSTCYYLGVDNVCTPSTKYLRPDESCGSVSDKFTGLSTCDDLRSGTGIPDPEIRCWYTTSTGCRSMMVQVRPGESCSDPYFETPACGSENSEVGLENQVASESGDGAEAQQVEESEQTQSECIWLWLNPVTWLGCFGND